MKQKLRLITENALQRKGYDDDVIALGNKMLENWLPRSLDAASNKKKELNLLSFSSTSLFNERPIHMLIDCGLIEYLQEQTELDVSVSHFLLENKNRIINQYDELDLDKIEDFHHLYVIKLKWYD